MRETRERRYTPREPLFQGRRRYPRVFLDLDWFLESEGCSTLGRGLEVSLRGALLPVARTGNLTAAVTLYLSLPARPRMFKAKGRAVPRQGPTGWVIQFSDVEDEDLRLLGETLLEEYGLSALPGLDRKYERFVGLHRRYLRSSLSPSAPR
ncbi:MAG: PilZ domain-containing protein [Myxococcota bacterium]